jgi:hypothetical protein
MGLAEYLANQRVMQEQRLGQPTRVQPAPAVVPTQAYGQPLGMPQNMAPAPGVFDRSQPTNPLERQLAVRRMLDTQGRGMTRGVGYDTSAAPAVVPQRAAFTPPRMPTPQRAPVTHSLYGGQ